MGPIACAETSVITCHYSLRNNTEVLSFLVWFNFLFLREKNIIGQLPICLGCRVRLSALVLQPAETARVDE